MSGGQEAATECTTSFQEYLLRRDIFLEVIFEQMLNFLSRTFVAAPANLNEYQVGRRQLLNAQLHFRSICWKEECILEVIRTLGPWFWIAS